jgi:hypothetical protein
MRSRATARGVLRRGIVVATILLGATASAAPDESLAELARRAREKRQQSGAKVYTDDDLRSGRRGAPEEPSPKPSATPAGDRAADPPGLEREREERQVLEKKWRERFDAARRKIQDAESRAWRNVIRAVVGPGGVIVPMEVREFEETEELREARQALADLEDELRRAGLPPGWGR